MSGRFVWGTVTAVAPLRVQLDGDTAELPIAPDSLVDPLSLAVGDRVRCELSRRRLVVHGRSGGEPQDARVVADDAGRAALATLGVLREGMLVMQKSDDTVWLCTDPTTPTWRRVSAPHNRQIDTANSLVDELVQSGVGKMSGAVATSLSEAVTFPVAFSAPPSVLVGYRGARSAGAFNDSGLAASGVVWGTGAAPTTTGFTAYLSQAGNFGTTNEYYYQWIAIGAR